MRPAEELKELFGAGFTQQQIASFTGMTQACISRIAAGINRNACMDTAEKIHCLYLANKHEILKVTDKL